LTAGGQVKRRAVDDACQVTSGFQSRSGQVDLKCRRPGGVADEGVAEEQRRSVGCAAHGNAEAPMVGPAKVDDERAQAGIENAKRHANA
jgi:hypothetical protein